MYAIRWVGLGLWGSSCVSYACQKMLYHMHAKFRIICTQNTFVSNRCQHPFLRINTTWYSLLYFLTQYLSIVTCRCCLFMNELNIHVRQYGVIRAVDARTRFVLGFYYSAIGYMLCIVSERGGQMKPGLRSALKKWCKTFIKRKRWCVEHHVLMTQVLPLWQLRRTLFVFFLKNFFRAW